MAIVPGRESDISGKRDTDDKFIEVVVREHPNSDEPKVLDLLIEEADLLEGIENLVILEVPKGDTKVQVYMTLAAFNSLHPNMEGVVKNARGTRGRRPGTRIARK